MSIDEIINDVTYDFRETSNKYLNNQCDYNSIAQKIPCNHMDSRTGAEIRFDLKGLETRKYPEYMKEILLDIMDHWHYNRTKIDAIVLIPHYGRGKKILANCFDLNIIPAIKKSQFYDTIYAYKSKLGDDAVHLVKIPLDTWRVKTDFDHMWSMNTGNDFKHHDDDSLGSPGVTP